MVRSARRHPFASFGSRRTSLRRGRGGWRSPRRSYGRSSWVSTSSIEPDGFSSAFTPTPSRQAKRCEEQRSEKRQRPLHARLHTVAYQATFFILLGHRRLVIRCFLLGLVDVRVGQVGLLEELGA